MKLLKTVFPRLFSLLAACVLAAALMPAALAAPVNDYTITSQAEWDALFDTNGVQTTCGQVTITAGDITNSHPFTCTTFSLTGGTFTTSAGITAAVKISGGTFTLQNAAAIYGNVTLTDGYFGGSSVYGDLFFQNGSLGSIPVIHNGTLYNQNNPPPPIALNLVGFSLLPGQSAQFTDCAVPALVWANPAQNGDGHISWPAVPNAAEYIINLYKDDPQSAPIATVTAAAPGCDFTDVITAAGSGTYYLSAQTIAQAPIQDAGGNWSVFNNSVLFFDYAPADYTAPDPVAPAPQPVPEPAPQPKENPSTGVPAATPAQTGSTFLWVAALCGGTALAALLYTKKHFGRGK